MKLRDYAELSLVNLWKKKLRTLLTTFGVVIGIGALVAMVAFGKGVQKNVTESFRAMELFNYITVFTSSFAPFAERSASERMARQRGSADALLDESALQAIRSFPGVEAAFPDIRFPAQVGYGDQREFTFVQVIPAEFATSKLIQLRAGKSYVSDDEDALIISDSLLRRLGVRDFDTVLNRSVTVSTLVLDFSGFPLADLAAALSGGRLPFAQKSYSLPVTGVSERMGMGGPSLLRSDVIIPADVAARMDKLAINDLSDLFNRSRGQSEYPLVNVRLSSPRYVDEVKSKIQAMGFRTFALIDQMEEIKTGFMFMDMFLLAVGMIAVIVASLGITNTMVMSILERYSEIGIMKAVGAANRDIAKIFVFESSVIGFLGGIFGLGLGWAVSRIINQAANYFLARQGVPYVEYFNFPWWIILGSILFAIVVSLISGMYPAVRASRVDPVVALRHD